MDDGKKQLKNKHSEASRHFVRNGMVVSKKKLTLNAEAILLVVTTAAKGRPFPNGLPIEKAPLVRKFSHSLESGIYK